MKKIERNIQHEQFQTINYGYNSLDDINNTGQQLYLKIKELNIDTVSFVSHSMGALLIRSMLQFSSKDVSFPKIFRIIMIAPPNKGTEIADFFSKFGLVNYILGPNLKYMKTHSNSYANLLPKPYNSEIAIIAGNQSKKNRYNFFLNYDNDGLVPSENTKLGIEKDYVIVKGKHNSMLRKNNVSNLVIAFLKNGSFTKNNIDI